MRQPGELTATSASMRSSRGVTSDEVAQLNSDEALEVTTAEEQDMEAELLWRESIQDLVAALTEQAPKEDVTEDEEAMLMCLVGNVKYY